MDTGLTSGATYYYTAFVYNTSNSYSSGVSDSATRLTLSLSDVSWDVVDEMGLVIPKIIGLET
ncbi:MAG: hypothetical protein KAT05_01975 [Spirochaetes bacterium]|nr:hypothetical protein [Spirochaetota bacterium]